MHLLQLPERRRKEIASLATRKGRQVHGQMLIEGSRSVKSAIEAGASLCEVLISEDRLQDAALPGLVAGVQCPIYRLTPKDARRISTVETHQGVIAVARIATPALEQFTRMPAVLVLDGVQDPGNVGTIIRTAAWFGVPGIIAGPGTADFFNPKVVRATMGGIWDVHLARVNDLPGHLETLKQAGISIVCADLEGQALHAWQPASQVAIVIGSEAHGVASEVQAMVDTAVTIQGAGKRLGTESLNAAMAAGIILYHWSAATP